MKAARRILKWARPSRAQRGHTLLLVLVFLMLGAMTIVPALHYVSTALHSQRISSQRMQNEDAFDSAIQDAVWKIINDGAIEEVNDHGEVAFDFELSMEKWGGYTIEVPKMAGGVWQTIRGNNRCKMEAYFLPDNEDPLIYYYTPGSPPDHPEPPRCGPASEDPLTFIYVVRLQMVQWDIEGWEFLLPPGLVYTDLSAACIGPESASRIISESRIDLRNRMYWREKQPAGWQTLTTGLWEEVLEMPATPIPGTYYLVKEWVGGQQKLTWRPGFSAAGNQTFLLVFEVTGTPPWGIHSLVPVFTQGVTVMELEPTASISCAMYNVIMTIGGQQVSAVIAVTPDGIKLISYQVME